MGRNGARYANTSWVFATSRRLQERPTGRVTSVWGQGVSRSIKNRPVTHKIGEFLGSPTSAECHNGHVSPAAIPPSPLLAQKGLPMAAIYTSVDQLIGHTPLLELSHIERDQNLKARVLVKLEYFNPGGSVKDRVAKNILDDAQARGLLDDQTVVIEPTSGNTGIGLAAICAARGIRLIITMPETMSIERRKLMGAYGAELVLTPGSEGMKGAIAKAEELHAQIPNSLIAGQFTNPANPAAHVATTGPEIWDDTDGAVDIFVAGVGTGGTITGVGSYLKDKNPAIQVIAVEPASSPVLSGGSAGPHGIQGIGAGFVPQVLDTGVYDEVIDVQDGDALACAQLVARTEGVLVGISSGAALWAALEAAKLPQNEGKTIVALLPDTGERYLSTALF